MRDTVDGIAQIDLSDSFDRVCQLLADVILGRSTRNMTAFLNEIKPTLGIHHIAYLRFETSRSDDVTLLTSLVTYSKAWQVRYFTKRYHELDPCVLVGLKAPAAFDWSPFRKLSPQSVAFFADAREHDVGVNGLTIPVRSRPGGFALVSFTSALGDADWEAYKLRHMARLELMSCLLDAAANVNTKLASSQIQLSRREHEALTWAARGKTASETASIMTISYASVRTYIETARRKLGCQNVTHAVAAALATGLIAPLTLKGIDPRGFTGKDEAEERAA